MLKLLPMDYCCFPLKSGFEAKKGSWLWSKVYLEMSQYFYPSPRAELMVVGQAAQSARLLPIPLLPVYNILNLPECTDQAVTSPWHTVQGLWLSEEQTINILYMVDRRAGPQRTFGLC